MKRERVVTFFFFTNSRRLVPLWFRRTVESHYRLNGRYFQVITRWAFRGLISTNRDGPFQSAPPPTPYTPSLHNGSLHYWSRDLNLYSHDEDFNGTAPCHRVPVSLFHVCYCPEVDHNTIDCFYLDYLTYIELFLARPPHIALRLPPFVLRFINKCNPHPIYV